VCVSSFGAYFSTGGVFIFQSLIVERLILIRLILGYNIFHGLDRIIISSHHTYNSPVALVTKEAILTPPVKKEVVVYPDDMYLPIPPFR
jgi:hypothetical protein